MENKVLGDAENVADPDEDLELQRLTLGCAGLPGLVDRQRPAQAKADDHKGFAGSGDGCRIHNLLPFLRLILTVDCTTLYRKRQAFSSGADRILPQKPHLFLEFSQNCDTIIYLDLQEQCKKRV